MFLIVWLLALTPAQAIRVVTQDAWERRDLRAIGWRESRLERLGVHPGDAWVGSRAWRSAVRVGRLDPQACPLHRRGDPRRWATRGSWGQIAAYAVPYLPGCWPPWALDVPVVGAWVAVRRLRRARRRDATRGLRAWLPKR